MRSKLLRWAKSEAEAAALQADGWRVAAQCLSTHHHRYSLLLERDDATPSPDAIGGQQSGGDIRS